MSCVHVCNANFIFVFLHFQMCQTCEIFYFIMFAHLYPHGMYRVNDEVFIPTLIMQIG